MRNNKVVTIESKGRDQGRTFVITEMSADQGERWADRLIFALANAGASLPDGVMDGGMAGLAAIGIAKTIMETMRTLRFEAIEPLLIEMMDSIQYQHAPKHPLQKIAAGANCQIQEISTFWTLRLAWIELHTGFSMGAAPQTTAADSASAPQAN